MEDKRKLMCTVKVFGPTADNPTFSSKVIYEHNGRESHYLECESAQEALFNCYYELVCAKFSGSDIEDITIPKFPNEIKIISEEESETIPPASMQLVEYKEKDGKDIFHFKKGGYKPKKHEVMVKFAKTKDEGWIVSNISYSSYLLPSVQELIDAIKNKK